jgi:hypothetical protein
MRFCYYKARTIHTTRQIITRVPINPYPNIVVSSNLKIVGFTIPMNYLELMVGQCMSHLAHNASRDKSGEFDPRNVQPANKRGFDITARCRIAFDAPVSEVGFGTAIQYVPFDRWTSLPTNPRWKPTRSRFDPSGLFANWQLSVRKGSVMGAV